MSCGKPCDCPTYRDHLLSVSVSAAAMPSRRPEAVKVGRTEAGWSKDMDAYKRLRRDGVQPRAIDGCAAVEKVATTREQIEGPQGT